MTHLAEGSGNYSTIIVNTPIKVPNFGYQEWVIAFMQQALLHKEREDWLRTLAS